MTARVRAGVGSALGAVAVLAVLVRAGWHPLVSWDARTEVRVHGVASRHPWLVDSARWLTHLGDPAVVTVAAFVLAALLARRRRRDAIYVVVVRAVAAALSSAVKIAVGRHRPVLPHPFAHAGGGSFPSGHALGSAALWGSVAVLLWLGRRHRAAVVAAVALPAVIGASRVVLGVHYVSDVVAGLLCGWVCAVGAVPVLARRRAAPGAGSRSPNMTPDRRW